MAIQKIKPITIEEYINAAPAAVQEKLWELHACIRKAAPGATENLKWRMPAYSYQKILVTFALFKNHIGFYPMPSAMEKFSKELNKYKTIFYLDNRFFRFFYAHSSSCLFNY